MAGSDRERRRREALRAQREQERLIAQQQREAQRQQREAEKAVAQADRERRAQYASARQDEAEQLNDQTAERVDELTTILRDGLKHSDKLDFKAMRIEFQPEPFSAGRLGYSEPSPEWERFAPPELGLFSRLFGGDQRKAKADQEARERFEQALSAHRQREVRRAAELAEEKERHDQRQAERQRHAADHNAEIDALECSYRASDQDAVERYLRMLVESTRLPDGIPDDVEVGYRTESRQVLILRELPDTDIVPTEASFKYVKSRDAIESTKRKPSEVKDRYADLIAQLALITLHNTFTATTGEQVSEVTVNCHLSTSDRATGKEIRPCLLTVSAGRDDFAELVLDKLEPRDCLRHLNALMSPHPYDVEPIRPLFDPDLSRFRLIDAHDAATGLDSRTVLVELHPSEFEHLVRQLFEAMGMKSWVTQASRDDGVDAVAVNHDPIMGGLSVIQAKRYAKVVPADAVRALWGVMEDKKAGTGVLVTTSYFGKATHDFAKRNERVRLIEGPELKQLISDHLDKDVILGAKRPPKNRG